MNKTNDEKNKEDVKKLQGVKFLNSSDLDDSLNLYRSFIVIIFSSLCLGISLGVNEMFKIIIEPKISQRYIVYYVIYIIILIIITLSMVYYLKVEIQ